MTPKKHQPTPTGERIRHTNTPTGPTGPNQVRVSYPHRVTLDLDDDRYEFIKQLVWEERTTLSELLRALIDTLPRPADPPPSETDQP